MILTWRRSEGRSSDNLLLRMGVGVDVGRSDQASSLARLATERPIKPAPPLFADKRTGVADKRSRGSDAGERKNRFDH